MGKVFRSLRMAPVLAVALGLLALGASLADVPLAIARHQTGPGGPVVNEFIELGGSVFVICIGVAVLKYRLYAIDRIVSRVISYAVITVVLAGLFAGLVVLATQVLPFKTPVAVAGRHAGRRCAVQPAAPPGAARGGPPVQPGPL